MSCVFIQQNNTQESCMYIHKWRERNHTIIIQREHEPRQTWGGYLSDLLYLFFHSLEFILSRLHLFPQLLDLVVENKLELLQLLILLLQVIDPLLLYTAHHSNSKDIDSSSDVGVQVVASKQYKYAIFCQLYAWWYNYRLVVCKVFVSRCSYFCRTSILYLWKSWFNFTW